jgi:7-carboxy-7-deazaguanine synthase
VKPIPISEIFGPTLQGEGALIGTPTVFVRTGACDYRCDWCDTLYAVLPQYKDEWTPMTPQQIVEEVLRLSGGMPILVTISGGNPALHELAELLDLGHLHGLTFALETQASKAKAWFEKLDHLTLSPKGPSSGMITDWEAVGQCIAMAGQQTQTSLKVVVFDEADYAYAREAHARFSGVPFFLQCGTDAGADATRIRENTEWLLSRVAQDGWFDVVILPQLHVLLWGNKRGV